MPGYPQNPGDGLIRTHDLLLELRKDIDAAYRTLDGDRDSQYLRRCVARAVFSYIEAIVECIKVELRSAIRLGHYTESLSAREEETLGSLFLVRPRDTVFLPLGQDIKRTFKLAAKLWRLDFKLNAGDTNFRDFLAAKSARDRLAHPKTFYDIQVSDNDMHCYTVAGMWLQDEFRRLFEARVRSLRDSISAHVHDALLDPNTPTAAGDA